MQHARGNEKYMNILIGRPEEGRDPFGDLGVDGNMELKLTVKKCTVKYGLI
jgi:hypothetical protein